jgi:uncharacterized protein (TIGR00369 family)
MTDTPSFDAIQARLDRSPFIRFLGLRVARVDPGQEEIALRMPMRAELERGAGSGQFHGGAIAALIDTAGDYALIVLLEAAGVPTIDFRVDFLRPAVDTELIATAKVRRAGRTIGVVDVDVHDGAGRLVAVGRGCYGTSETKPRSAPA